MIAAILRMGGFALRQTAKYRAIRNFSLLPKWERIILTHADYSPADSEGILGVPS